MKKERIEYLDILKGIGIFFVVYNHVAMLPGNTILGNIVMCISYGAVPCFMMVTGGLMHSKKEWNWQKYLIRMIKMYLILCFWKGAYLIFYNTISSVSVSAKDLIKYLFLFGTLQNVNSGLLWYLEAYLAVMVFYPVTWFLFRNGKNGRLPLLFWGGAVYLGCLGGMVSSRFAGVNIQAVAPSMLYGNMFFYFIAGAFLLEEREKIRCWLAKGWQTKALPFVMVFIGTLGLLLIKYLKSGTFCWEQIHVPNSYYRISAIILSVGIYLAVMVLVSHKKKEGSFFGEFFGKTTMGIYVLHGILVPCIQIFVFTYFPGNESLILHVLVTIGTVVVCAAVTKLLQKIPVVRALFL